MSSFSDKLAQALGKPSAGREATLTSPFAPRCPYCEAQAQLVGGAAVYPHRPDLYDLKFWACQSCEAHVGCHKAGAWMYDEKGRKLLSDGTLPLGRLANAELRQAKQRVHRAFDPLWQSATTPPQARVQAYAWLADELGLDWAACHVGQFDLETCEKAAELAEARLERLVAGDESAAFTGTSDA